MNRKWTEQLSATPLDFALAQTYQFEVTAHSLGNSHIQDRDLADVTFTGYEGVEVGWIPMTQTLTNTVEATYLLVVTNTGNVNTTYDLSLAAPGLDFDLEDTILTIPPHIAAATIVRLRPATAGIYTILGQATTASLSDSSTAILVVTADVFAGANDDFVTLFEDGAITILVLANDQQGETPFTIIAISQPTHGTAVLHPPNTVSYTPTANYNGPDTFTYTVSDGQNITDTATVITPNTVITLPVLANDTNLIDGDTIFVTGISQPVTGTAVLNPDQTVTISPPLTISVLSPSPTPSPKPAAAATRPPSPSC